MTKIFITDSSYNLNNLNIVNDDIIIFTFLEGKINNLPFDIKEIWLNSNIKNFDIKLPFGCVIKFFDFPNL